MEKTENPAEGCRIWYASDMHQSTVGYLVTEPGDINRPMAFIPEHPTGTVSRTEAREIAQCVTVAPSLIENGSFEGHPVIDLRPYGRPDSNMPMPSWVYGLKFLKTEDKEGKGGDGIERQCRPLDLPLLKELVVRLIREKFCSIAIAETPHVCITINEYAWDLNQDGDIVGQGNFSSIFLGRIEGDRFLPDAKETPDNNKMKAMSLAVSNFLPQWEAENKKTA